MNENTVEVEADEIGPEQISNTLKRINGMGMKMDKCLFQIIQVDPDEGSFKAVVINRIKEKPKVG